LTVASVPFEDPSPKLQFCERGPTPPVTLAENVTAVETAPSADERSSVTASGAVGNVHVSPMYACEVSAPPINTRTSCRWSYATEKQHLAAGAAERVEVRFVHVPLLYDQVFA
jgi:hypothetical protein